MEGYMDENGNSDIQGAKDAMLNERDKWKKDNISSNTVLIRKAERPMTIDEAVLKTEGSPFPVMDLKDRLIELQTSAIYKGAESIGRFMLDASGSVTWREDVAQELSPIVTLEYNKDSDKGAVVIYNHPQRYERGEDTGNVYANRYIAGIDPIEFDKNEVGNKYSLMACFVMDAFTEDIVAEYVGREEVADDGYEIIRRLLTYYNAEANYENQLKGLYRYFHKRNSLHLLSDAPKMLAEKLQMKLSSERKKGTVASPRINNYALHRINDWLVRPVPGALEDEQGITITNLQRLKSKGLIEELIAWFKDGNFDRVSAVGMLMILLDEQDAVINTKGTTMDNSFASTKFYSKALNLMQGYGT